MLQHIIPATGLLFTLENILWINIESLSRAASGPKRPYGR